ncbi:outer dynein arm-docking complex subunit 2 isoform X3 [Gasterosteus aculeatus]
MGLSLTRAAQWTTAASGVDKLAPTPMNESLLKEVLCFVEQFSSQHPQEAELVFEEPLQWSTTLVASDFKTDYDISDLDVQSPEKDNEGRPLLQLFPPTVCVRSFSQLSKLVKLADNKKMEEVQACLEENRDPVVKILGPSLDSILEKEDAHTDGLSLVDEGKEEDQGKESDVKVKLFLLLQDLDKQLLSKCLKAMDGRVGLDPDAVRNEVEMLKRYCSEGEKRVLKSVRYTSDYVFSNGCRAPPWRQVLNEICYLVIEPCDTETLYITCSTAGVFLNGGINREGEQTSDVFEDIGALLKSTSPHFAQNANEQDFEAQELPPTQKTQHVESVDAEEQGQLQRSDEQQEKNVHEKAKQQHAPNKAHDRKKYEPCPRWKNLGLVSPCGKTPAGSVPVDTFSESSSESEEEEEQSERRPESDTDLPSEYWQIQKLVKYLKVGDQTATVLTLCAIMDFNLMQETCQLAIRDVGGLEVLINLLDTDEVQCKVKLLDCVPNLANLTAEQEKDVEVARCGTLALWSCSKSTNNKEAIRKAGGVFMLGRLLKSPHENMLIPVVGTLQECASEEKYRIAIQTEGMIKDLVKNLSRDNDELQMHCANAIFKCAQDKQTRYLVRQYKGLQPLVSLLSKAHNKQLLAAATGAIWKCSISVENVTKFQEYKALETLLRLLTDQPEEVLVNVVGAVGEFAQIPDNKATIRNCGGIRSLVNLLTGTNQALLVNVTKAVGACATDMDNMIIIDKLDGVRLVWSLLKNPCADVQSSAAWALCQCIENAKDAGEMVRSLVGGLELIVNLLKSTNNKVLASICAAIAKIARNEENLAVLTDHGVVQLLTKLTNTTDDRLRRHLAEAVGHCCMWGSNRASFGDAGAVAPLVHYLKSKDKAVHKTTAMALYQLSRDPNNCITMHDRGVVKPLIYHMGSDDEMLLEAAAGCVRNIRLLAQENRKAKLFH